MLPRPSADGYAGEMRRSRTILFGLVIACTAGCGQNPRRSVELQGEVEIKVVERPDVPATVINVEDGILRINGQDFGQVKPGDSVQVYYGRITVNGTAREPRPRH